MYILTAKIEIKGAKTWIFDKVASVEIERNAETLTDTCKITLPKKVKWQGETVIPIKRGDKVTVSLGYDGDPQLAFIGYVTTIGVKSPLVINCEDEMFSLKQKAAEKKAYKSCNLETLLKEQNLGVSIKVFGEQNLGAYRVTVSTVAELLNELKKNGIRSFFRYDTNGVPTLYSGVLFPKQGSIKQCYKTGVNIISDDSLDQQKADDVKLKVKAVSLDRNNKKIAVEVGDADGEKRTLQAYNKTESELKEWAKQELSRLKRDGLTGDFTTFGAILVDKLDTIGIILDGQKQGTYQVNKNIITYDTGGFRQRITIGDRIQ